MINYVLAIDIGASSGRHIVGYLENNKIKTIEVYRFKNGVKEENNHLVWDIDYLFEEVKKGIKVALNKYPNISSLSIDTWGVDYVLLDKNNQLIPPVYAYRDKRCDKIINEVHNIISQEELYKETGTQFQPFNTIYQLYTDKINHRLDNAYNYLMIPEYLIYLLTGKMIHEYTNASTTGLINIKTKEISNNIINKLGLKKELFTHLTKPGEFSCELKPCIKEEVNGNPIVKLCATHDTASAVMALDIDSSSIYISSGTWSLLGVKLDEKEDGITSLDSSQANYSNEYGPNYIRFQKNIMGLWIIQLLQKQINLSFEEMNSLAAKSNYQEIFDVNDEVFLSPDTNNKNIGIKETISTWFKKHNKPLPINDSDYIYTCINSLAWSYKLAVKDLEKITNKQYKDIYIVGGGAKNQLLNELTKKYTNKEVYPLPIEATAIGNIKCQMEK